MKIDTRRLPTWSTDPTVESFTWTEQAKNR